MANPEHLAILKQGGEVWNQWREENSSVEPDLRETNVERANLSKAMLSKANFNNANLNDVILADAYLR